MNVDLVSTKNIVISWLVLGALAIIYGFWASSLIKRKHITASGYQTIALIAFGIYALALIYLTFLPYQVSFDHRLQNAINAINFIPIATIDPTGFMLNVLMTLPLGMFLRVLFNVKTVRSTLYLCLCVSGSIEILQFLSGAIIGNWRQVDINDIIANCLGSILGFAVIYYLVKIQSLRSQISRFAIR